MKKSLYLVRHAEAETSGAHQKDFDRELTPHGMVQASKLGRKISEKNVQMDKIYCSNAPRACMTAQLIAEQIKFNPDNIIKDEEMYESSVRTLARVLNAESEKASNIMIVGHNPVISYFAEFISGETVGSLPLGSVTIIEFECEWKAIVSHTGKMVLTEEVE
jgi:phosphohistidine phosphatase